LTGQNNPKLAELIFGEIFATQPQMTWWCIMENQWLENLNRK